MKVADALATLNTPTGKRVRKRRTDAKYSEKHVKDLMSGIRYKQNLSVAHLCRKWRISETTYRNWIERYPEFKNAHEVAKMDYEAYLMDRMHANLNGEEKGSAAVINFALSNIAGWSTKTQVEHKKEEQIMAININILQPAPRAAITQKEDDAIDGELVTDDNVVKIDGR